MGKAQYKDFDSEYGILRLQYALENEEINKVFEYEEKQLKKLRQLISNEPKAILTNIKPLLKFNKFDKIIMNKVLKPVYEKSGLLEDGRYLIIKIDLSTKDEDIEEKLEYYKKRIELFKAIAGDINLSSSKGKARRQNIKLYKQYLKVYHLVKEKGEKWTEIAKEIFPKDFKSEDELSESDSDQNPESAIAKVHHYYKEAKRLIAEGLP